MHLGNSLQEGPSKPIPSKQASQTYHQVPLQCDESVNLAPALTGRDGVSIPEALVYVYYRFCDHVWTFISSGAESRDDRAY